MAPPPAQGVECERGREREAHVVRERGGSSLICLFVWLICVLSSSSL